MVVGAAAAVAAYVGVLTAAAGGLVAALVPGDAAVAATFALCHFATVGVERVVDAAVRDGRES